MEDLILEIPECPDSISTGEARELFIDVCEEAIQHHRLTKSLVEAITGYCFLTQINDVVQRHMIHSPDDWEWHEMWAMCVKRELEYSEIIGLTPLDRKNLGLF